MQDIVAELRWRGLIHQSTGDQVITDTLLQAPRTVYAGFDPTAESLHVGSLMPLLLLRRFQRAGHQPIALVGGSTGMIGDPSGKSEERNLLDAETLQTNIHGIEQQMRQLLDFDQGPQSAILLNNYDWMRQFSYLDFLRAVGKHAPVSVMLAKESVKGRLDRGDVGISYTEFSYQLLQAYDFVYLAREYQCLVQVGGSDQWGNITAGIDLARRMDGTQLHGLTCPLLTKSDGSKMGKTESGAVWLSAKRTSPYAFYQYWINVPDEDAGQCLRFLTDLDAARIAELDQARQTDPQQRDSQQVLAAELTRLIHGETGLAQARQATHIFFGAEISQLSDASLASIFSDVPSHDVPRAQLRQGVPLLQALVATGLAQSISDARRGLQQGGIYVNNRRVEKSDLLLTAEHLASESMIVLRSGRRRYALVRVI